METERLTVSMFSEKTPANFFVVAKQKNTNKIVLLKVIKCLTYDGDCAEVANHIAMQEVSGKLQICPKLHAVYQEKKKRFMIMEMEKLQYSLEDEESSIHHN